MSPSPESSHPDLDALAQQLGAMPLAPAAVSRDQLFFRAGQAHGAAKRRRRFALAATLLTCIGLGAGTFLGRWTGPGPLVVEKLVFVQPAPPTQQREPEGPRSPAIGKSNPTQPEPVYHAVPAESLASALRLPMGQAGNLEALLSESGSFRPMAPSTLSKTESVEEVLGLPLGSLSDTERSRWSAVLFLGGKS